MEKKAQIRLAEALEALTAELKRYNDAHPSKVVITSEQIEREMRLAKDMEEAKQGVINFKPKRTRDMNWTRVDRMAGRIADKTGKSAKELRKYIYLHHAADIVKRGAYNCISKDKARQIERILS